MHAHIRRLEHRAEQLAIRIEELAEQPDVARIAMVGIAAAIALCWFAVAWGEGVLLLALPLVAFGCVVAARGKLPGDDPGVPEADAVLGPERQEIDQWLNRVTNAPARPEPDPEPLRVAFHAPAPSLDARLAPDPAPVLEPLPEPEPLPEHRPAVTEALPEPPVTTLYEVCEIRAGARVLLEVRSSFDSAVDAAFELIDERETAWAYDRDASENRPRGTLDLFGFDATRWSQARR